MKLTSQRLVSRSWRSLCVMHCSSCSASAWRSYSAKWSLSSASQSQGVRQDLAGEHAGRSVPQRVGPRPEARRHSATQGDANTLILEPTETGDRIGLSAGAGGDCIGSPSRTANLSPPAPSSPPASASRIAPVAGNPPATDHTLPTAQKYIGGRNSSRAPTSIRLRLHTLKRPTRPRTSLEITRGPRGDWR